MPTITVRISEEEKRRLLEHGNLSRSVREALELYLNAKKSDELLRKLERLQRGDSVSATPLDEARLISEDRKR